MSRIFQQARSTGGASRAHNVQRRGLAPRAAPTAQSILFRGKGAIGGIKNAPSGKQN